MIQIGLTDYTPENKIIDIKNKNGAIRAKYAIGEKDILKYTLMSEHYIEISFELNRNVSFKRSDYIEWEGDKYTLRSDYKPEQINKRKYQYTLLFEGVEMFFQDIQYYYLNQGLKESEWRLTGNPRYFIKIAVDNINRYFGTTSFNIGTIEPTEIKDIVFDTNTNIFDALTQIADEYNAEWYITGKTLHLLNKVSFGSEVDFETEVSVLSMKREEGESSAKYTRIVALGSTRNIPKDYRAASSGEAVDAIYSKRLRIPVSKGDVINAYPDMSPDEVVEGTVIFDEVYPKRIGTIEAVGTIEYTDTDQETEEQTKWNAYKFKDSGINFKEEYKLPEQELRLSFQSGDLNGRDFALIFHEKGFSDTDDSQFFEIVRTDEYGRELPNDIMKPKPGDKYVLYGFNIALVSDQYVPEAEKDLYDIALAWLQKQLQDTGVYECTTAIKYFMDNLMDLAIGQKVRLVDEQFESGFRSSRIMGFEKKLYNKYDAIYTVGDNSTYSRFGQLEKDIKELQHAGNIYENTGGGSNVYVIKQFDSTRPTDFNVYSAAASDAKYFNKQTGGTVSGDTVFQKNVQVQGITISDVFQNSTFTAGQLGSGFQIKKDANGQSYVEVDNLLVRREAVFNRITIAEIKSVGGTILLSLASMVVSKVEADTSTWKCYFNNEDGTIPNDFALGDQAICRKFTGKNIKYYWALVTAVGADYIQLSKTDKDGSGIPGVDDEVVQLGNRTDVNRQSAIMLSTYGSDAPSIKQYAGINSYDMTGKEVTAISPKGNKFTGSFTISTNGSTAPIYKDVGLFVNGRVHYLNDRVSHLGSYWVCIVNNTIQTPNESSTVWRKDTTGKTDIDNAVNGIQVGGRNILIGKGWATERSFARFLEIRTRSIFQNDVGKSVVLSFDLKATIPRPIAVYPYQTSGISVAESTGISPTTEYKRYSLLFTIKDWGQIAGHTTGGIGFYDSAGENTIYIRRVKIEFGNKATDWTPAPEDVETDIAKAKQDALNAQTTATSAQSSANTANSLLTDIASDNKLTAGEKHETMREWTSILSEYPKNVAQAGKFSVPATAYTGAYNILSRYITPLLSNLGTTSNINGATFRATFKAYYDARTDLLNAISVKAKELADNAQTGANNAQKEAEKVRSEYQSDFIVLSGKIESKVSQLEFNALGQRVRTAESTITQLPDQITFAVSETKEYTNNAVNGIQVGGRNILIGKGWATERSFARFLEIRTRSIFQNDVGKSVVISFDLKATIARPISVYPYQTSGISVAESTGISPTTEYKRYSLLFTIKDWGQIAGHTTGGIGFYDYAGENTIYIKRVKIEFGNKATDWTPAPEDVETDIAKAKQDALNAQTTATSAQSSANTANSLLTDIASDNKLTAGEKHETMREWTSILSEYPKNVAQAGKFSVPATAYTGAYNILSRYITPLLSNLGTTSNINGTTFRETFKAYYDARTDLLNAISAKTKELADNAQMAASNVKNEVEKVRTQYESDFVVLSNKIGSKVAQSDFGALDQRVKTAESTIQQLPDQITFAVSETKEYTNNAVNGIQVGGRNILIGKGWATERSFARFLEIRTRSIFQNDVGKSVVISFDLKATIARPISVYPYQTSGISVAESTGISPTIEYKRYSLLFTIKDWGQIAGHTTGGIGFYDYAGENTIYIRRVKIEFGNKATDWTPAPEDVEADIDNIKVGAINLLTNSKNLTLSNSWRYISGLKDNEEITVQMWGEGTIDCYVDNGHVKSKKITSVNKYVKHTYQVKPYTSNAANNGTVLLIITCTNANIKVERGNKATDWSAAPEDIQTDIDGKTTLEEVSSSFTMTANKITLASKTIELKGTTIAKAIEAEDLKVGSRTGLSALEVLRDGTFYAKGSKIVYDPIAQKELKASLTIDSSSQSIEIESPYTASWNESGGETPPGQSSVKISSQTGGIQVRDTNNNASIISTSGVFSNNAGQGAFALGNPSRAAVVGLGFGNMEKDYLQDYNNKDYFIAGVIGTASNSNPNPAPAYGGWFSSLKANGFIMSMKTITERTTTNIYLDRTTTFVLGNSAVMQNVYLPNNAYPGTVIWLKQWWTGYMRIRARSPQELYDDSTKNDYLDVGEGSIGMCIYIGEWTDSSRARGIWMFSRFKY